MRQTTDTLTRPVSGADEAKVSRRALLKVGATAAGGLALAVALPAKAGGCDAKCFISVLKSNNIDVAILWAAGSGVLRKKAAEA